LKELFQGRSGVKIFENANAYPRVWSVHQAASLPALDQLHAKFRDPSVDLRKTVLLTETAPELSACDGDDEVQMPVHTPNVLRITATMKCRGMVILTDTWFPGWRASVDGKSAKIYQAYGAVRGVVVEPGEHVIEMRYRPASVFIGLALTLLAGAIVLVVRR
jgi:hypothetical protein